MRTTPSNPIRLTTTLSGLSLLASCTLACSTPSSSSQDVDAGGSSNGASSGASSSGSSSGGASSSGGSSGSGSSSGGSSSGGSSGSGSSSGGSSSGGSSGSGSSSGGGSSSGSSSGGNADAGGSPQPFGNIPGTWTLAFDDEFNGNSLDTTTWTTMPGSGWGSTQCEAANVSVSGGNLVLLLASSSSGGCVCTGISCPQQFSGDAGPAPYSLPVGAYTEARVNFPGSGANIDNWPAWWVCGPDWPAAGENDIAEGLGQLAVSYHSPSGANPNGDVIAGNWANAFHVYGVLRQASSSQVYYDGQMVASYPTDDNGAPESLIFDIMGGYGATVYGTGSQVLVDYARAWQ